MRLAMLVCQETEGKYQLRDFWGLEKGNRRQKNRRKDEKKSF
jgi:hypothetical protein